jgi:hypothetical protein
LKQTIVYVAPGQLGKVFGLMYFLLGILFLPLFLIPALTATDQQPYGVYFVLTFPVLYGVAGYLGMAFFAWIYNRIVGRVGGVEIVVRESAG